MVHEITQELRPCYANNKKALFHRWIDKETPILKFKATVSYECKEHIIGNFNKNGILPSFCEAEKITETLAIIEYEDGTVAEVRPTEIRFADNKTREYAF